MKDKTKKTPASRRRFIENGIMGSTGIALGLVGGKFVKSTTNDTVKMITATGEVVEIPKKFIPEGEGKKVSNRELKKWIDQERQNTK